MYGRTVLLMVAAGIYTLPGCVSAGFRHVSVSAGNDDGIDVPLTGRSVFIVPNTRMQDTILEARVRAHLEDELLERGYAIASPANADLYVIASFGEIQQLAPATASILNPAGVTVTRAADGSLLRKRHPDEIEHAPVLQVENTLSLLVSASDAKFFRETGRVETIWRGEASTPGKPYLLPRVMPYLLASAVRYFGKSSRGVQTLDVRDAEIRNWQTIK